MTLSSLWPLTWLIPCFPLLHARCLPLIFGCADICKNLLFFCVSPLFGVPVVSPTCTSMTPGIAESPLLLTPVTVLPPESRVPEHEMQITSVILRRNECAGRWFYYLVQCSSTTWNANDDDDGDDDDYYDNDNGDEDDDDENDLLFALPSIWWLDAWKLSGYVWKATIGWADCKGGNNSWPVMTKKAKSLKVSGTKRTLFFFISWPVKLSPLFTAVL